MEYDKNLKTIEEQINTLRIKGLIIDDESKLRKYLAHISYYHLSTYFKSFQDSAANFKKNTRFEDILNIYVFDKKLRLLLLDVLEIVEKSFKCKLAYKITVESNNSQWFSDMNLFYDEKKYRKYILPILKKAKLSKDEGLRNYYVHNLAFNYPPAWILIDSLTYGETVNLFRWLNIENRNKISRDYVLDEKYLLSWMYGLSVLRNICAHHSRLWNRELFVGIKKDAKLYKELFNPKMNNRLYNYLVILQIMICKINPTSTWIERLIGLINEHWVHTYYMGFPDNWINLVRKIKEIG